MGKILLILVVFFFLISAPNIYSQPGPQAITRSSLPVYDSLPAYSLIKGRFVFGKQINNLIPGMQVEQIDFKLIGEINIWWRIRFIKNGVQYTGWINAGIQNGNERSYDLVKSTGTHYLED